MIPPLNPGRPLIISSGMGDGLTATIQRLVMSNKEIREALFPAAKAANKFSLEQQRPVEKFCDLVRGVLNSLGIRDSRIPKEMHERIYTAFAEKGISKKTVVTNWQTIINSFVNGVSVK